MVSKYDVLALLPPYNDQWELVKENQYVRDIVREILESQSRYGKYYDRFSWLFLSDSVDTIANELYAFCKRWIKYREESKYEQTAALPTGILTRGVGDCKHYALFTGGVLGSLNRLYSLGLKWCYCFAAYRGEDEPYHVFVSLYDPETDCEIWIDPTPGAGGNPTLLIKRYV